MSDEDPLRIYKEHTSDWEGREFRIRTFLPRPRFLVFKMWDYHPSGGAEDLHSVHEDLDAAFEAATDGKTRFDVVQILDLVDAVLASFRPREARPSSVSELKWLPPNK